MMQHNPYSDLVGNDEAIDFDWCVGKIKKGNNFLCDIDWETSYPNMDETFAVVNQRTKEVSGLMYLGAVAGQLQMGEVYGIYPFVTELS